MKALLISDMEYQTETFHRLEQIVHFHLSQKGFETEDVRIGRNELAYCMGCFGCWIKKPGECVINDKMSDINRSYNHSDAVFYLSPVVFGQFSCNIKNAMDRWLPNVLPFFVTRKDGSTMHPPRYRAYPTHVMIGYGDEITEDERHLFSDICLNHRSNMNVLLYQGDDDALAQALHRISLEKQGGEL